MSDFVTSVVTLVDSQLEQAKYDAWVEQQAQRFEERRMLESGILRGAEQFDPQNWS